MFKDLKQILRKEQVNLFLIIVFPIFFLSVFYTYSTVRTHGRPILRIMNCILLRQVHFFSLLCWRHVLQSEFLAEIVYY
jgi:predicted permease